MTVLTWLQDLLGIRAIDELQNGMPRGPVN